MQNKRSCKINTCIAYLEDKIEEIDYLSDSRNGRIKRALLITSKLSKAELKTKAQDLKKLKSKLPETTTKPNAIQVIIDEDLSDILLETEDKIKDALNISQLRSSYEIEILLFVLLADLQKNAMRVGEVKAKKQQDLSGPDMVKTLVEIIMLDREEDKEMIEQIKNILMRWEV